MTSHKEDALLVWQAGGKKKSKKNKTKLSSLLALLISYTHLIKMVTGGKQLLNPSVPSTGGVAQWVAVSSYTRKDTDSIPGHSTYPGPGFLSHMDISLLPLPAPHSPLSKISKHILG